MGPICFCTDGHASRFYPPLLEWIHERTPEGDAIRDLYITPPNATGTLCWLDQLFQHLHRHYSDKVIQLKKIGGLTMRIDKYEAVTVVCNFWREWASEKSIARAKRVCGLDERGRWSIDTIPKENFMISDKWEEDKARAVAEAAREAPSWEHLDGSGCDSSFLGSPSQAPLKLLPLKGNIPPLRMANTTQQPTWHHGQMAHGGCTL